MILLDTHIWIWLMENSPKLTEFHRSQLEKHRENGWGVSVISIWELAVKHAAG